MVRTIQLAIDVTVINAPDKSTEEEDRKLVERVLNAIIPHPDSVIYTSRSDEHVTVLATDWTVR